MINIYYAKLISGKPGVAEKYSSEEYKFTNTCILSEFCHISRRQVLKLNNLPSDTSIVLTSIDGNDWSIRMHKNDYVVRIDLAIQISDEMEKYISPFKKSVSFRNHSEAYSYLNISKTGYYRLVYSLKAGETLNDFNVGPLKVNITRLDDTKRITNFKKEDK